MDPVVIRYAFVWLWLISGVLGLGFRLFLFDKFHADLTASKAIGASEARKRISIRGMQSAALHMGVKGMVAIIGLLALFFVPRPAGPFTVFELVLDCAVLLIPWLGMIDAFLEWRHQDWLLYQRPVADVVVEEHIREEMTAHRHTDGGDNGNDR